MTFNFEDLNAVKKIKAIIEELKELNKQMDELLNDDDNDLDSFEFLTDEELEDLELLDEEYLEILKKERGE